MSITSLCFWKKLQIYKVRSAIENRGNKIKTNYVTTTVYRLYDFTPPSASVYTLKDFKPFTDGVKSLSLYIYRLEDITPLVTGVKYLSIYFTD